MKRSLKDLQNLERTGRERQEDDILRAQLEREEAAESAKKKQKNKVENYSTKWKEHLTKWDEMGLCGRDRLSSLSAWPSYRPHGLPPCLSLSSFVSLRSPSLLFNPDQVVSFGSVV